MLEAKNVHKVYSNANKDLHVLKGIDLNIEKAKFIALVGPSGAGKSTLLHILGGLDTPSQGKVLLEGEDIYQLGDRELCKIRNLKSGFVFQFYHLLSEFNVWENVLMPARISVKNRTEYAAFKERARDLLDKVGLAERAEHFPAQLSGGEKQRAAIARALINRPQILFCDEPTGNLDSHSGQGIMALIKKINLEEAMTVVLVTHNLELAKISDKIYQLRDGVLVN